MGMWFFYYTDADALGLVEYIACNPDRSTDNVITYYDWLHYQVQMRLFEEYGSMYEGIESYIETCDNDGVITDETYIPPYAGPKSYYWINFANYYYAELRSWPPVLLTG